MQLEATFCGHLDLKGGQLRRFAAGPKGDLWALISLGPADDWLERLAPHDWLVTCTEVGDGYAEFVIPNRSENFNLVQPLPDGILLATPRYRPGDPVPNAKVFDFAGQLLREFLLGDGIEDLQATKSGRIWVSYFDEGVFGSLHRNDLMGRWGLRQVDGYGSEIFRFQPVSGLNDIVDCYALNATTDTEAWCCYYTDFPIVKIVDGRIEQFWQSPVRGSHGFCVWKGTLLMQGGYDSDEWTLVRLGDQQSAQILSNFKFVDKDGEVLKSNESRARGESIWFVRRDEVYHVSLRDLMALA